MKAPSFWYRPAGTLAAMLSPLGDIYAAATRRRLATRPAYRPKVPVVCIGNVTAGGSGKTPLALALAKMLIELGRNPAFVSRGYGGKLKGPVKVDPARHTAADVGDEPLLLARQAPVWIARDRAAAARQAEQESSILILDDGLQNPSIAKDFSILVIDGETGIGNGLCIPAGPLREPLSNALKRAQAMVIIGKQDKQNLAAQAVCPVFRADFTPTNLDKLPRDRPFLAFAGIGRPEKFYATCREAGLHLAATRDFPDHHAFRQSDLDALAEESRRLGATLLTTEKDRARLPRNFAQSVHALRVDLVLDNRDEVSATLKSVTNASTPKAAFHASRRMFAIIGDQPVLAEENTTEGHAEWFIRMGWIASRDDSAFETIVRGYSDGKDLYAYRGKAFLDDAPVETAMKAHASTLKNMMRLPDTANLFLGSVPQAIGIKWPPRRTLGRLDAL